MEERRRFVRLDTRLAVSYDVLPSEGERMTVLKDVGGGGVCLFADRPLPPGTGLRVSMKLPDRQDPVRFTAEVVWSEPYEIIGQTSREQAVEVGVRFLEIAPQEREAILQHVILGLRPNRSS